MTVTAQTPSTAPAEALQTFLAEYESGHIARSLEHDPSEIAELRRRGVATAKANGFPTTHDEEWRFTPVTRLAAQRFVPSRPGAALPKSAELDRLFELTPLVAVVVDGFFRADLSKLTGLPKGVTLKGLAETIASSPASVAPFLGKAVEPELHTFAALNAALFADGLYLHVDKGVVVEPVLQVLHVTTSDSPTASHTRSLVVAEEASSITIFEAFFGPQNVAYLNNSALEAVVRPNATVDHYRYQAEGKEAFHFSAIQALQERSSNFSTQAFTWGGGLVRNDIGTALNGPGAVGTVNGLYLIGGNQLVDNHTRIDHAVEHCESHEYYKGILDGNSRGVFNGRILVRQDAQKTNALQTNKNLLLSRDAQINTNPQLEIFADDVKCTHGATVGQLDAGQLFYLQSRGISKATATQMLTFAFANNLIQFVKPQTIRLYLESHVLPPGVRLEELEG